MQSPVRILFSILLLFFGYHAIKIESGGYEIGIFDFANYFSICLVIILTIIVLAKDIDIFRSHKKLYHFIPSIIGITIITIVAVKMTQRSQINSSATILKVRHIPKAMNVWTFEFKKNEHFKLTDYNLLGQTLYYGSYSISGDTVTIKGSNYDANVNNFPNKGVIRNDTMFWIKFDTMLVEKPG
jgi:hypothetical protein